MGGLRHLLMGMFLARDGVGQPGFQQLLDLVCHGERLCWVKLTGVYRISVAPGFADVAPMAQALFAAAPDRVIWGSDYSHLSFLAVLGDDAGEHYGLDPIESMMKPLARSGV